MPEIEIFRAGTHTGIDGKPRTFTREDIAAIASGYDVAAYHAPIVVGHPETDAPAYGWVKGLAQREDILVAEIDQVEPQFAEMHTAGRFKYPSAAFFLPHDPTNPRKGQWSLRHVGFLGAQPPAVRGLKPAAFAAGAEFIAFALMDWQQSSIASLFRGLREHLISTVGLERADQVLPSGTIDSIAQIYPDAGASLGIGFAQPKPKEDPMPESTAAEAARLAEERAKLDREKAALQSERVAFAASQKALRDAEDEGFVEGLVKDGKLLPANKADTLALLKSLPGEGTMVAFAAGEKSPHAAMRELLGRGGKMVAFGRQAPGGGSDVVDPGNAADIQRRAGAWMKTQEAAGFSPTIAEAIQHVTEEAA